MTTELFPNIDEFPLWYSQRQLASMFGVTASSINSALSTIRKSGVMDTHESIMPLRVRRATYQVLFYDLYAIFLISARTKSTNTRGQKIFWAGLDWISSEMSGRIAEFIEFSKDAIGTTPIVTSYDGTPPNEAYDSFIQTIATISNVSNDASGYIYILGRQDGLHKIGMTIDPVTRIRTLESEHGKLELVRLIECEDRRKTEKELHQKYALKRVEYEWFNLSADELCEFSGGNWLSGVMLPQGKQAKLLKE